MQAVLQRLAAPARLVQLVGAFYSGCRRLFSAHGVVGLPEWHSCGRGLMQGCPLLAAAVMRVWAASVLGNSTDVAGGVYLDDRTVWTRTSASPSALRAAKERSDRFDFCFGLSCNPTKCAVVAKNPAAAGKYETYEFGYGAVATQLDLLGLRYQLEGAEPCS